MHATGVMTANVITVTPDTSVRGLAELLGKPASGESLSCRLRHRAERSNETIAVVPLMEIASPRWQ
jgi:CBS domain-containing protein